MVDLETLRIAEHVHGHAGWLVAATLVHPAILLRHTKRRAHLSVLFSVLAPTAVGALGAVLYVSYRERIKQQIFIQSPTIGYLFERKEHLAFGAIGLAWAGAIAYFAATRTSGEMQERLRVLAHRAFVGSAGLAIITATLGTIVAVYKSF